MAVRIPQLPKWRRNYIIFNVVFLALWGVFINVFRQVFLFKSVQVDLVFTNPIGTVVRNTSIALKNTTDCKKLV